MRVSTLVLAIFGMLLTGPSCAQGSGPVVFKFVGDEVAAGGTKVFRGVEANPRYWRNVVVSDLATLQSNDDYCTGTLIGPEAMLTAAHCMVDGDNQLRPAVVQIGKSHWTLSCMRSERQKQDDTFDYALCRLKKPDKADPLPDDLYFDAVDTRPIAKGEPVLLVGYGGETMSIGPNQKIVAGPRTRAFRIGDEMIADPATATSPAMLINSNGTEPALCPGDSGGPLMSGVSTKDQAAERSIRAINFSISAGAGAIKYRSTVIALANPVFTELLQAWRNANPGVLVCEIGVTAHQGRCL